MFFCNMVAFALVFFSLVTIWRMSGINTPKPRLADLFANPYSRVDEATFLKLRLGYEPASLLGNWFFRLNLV